ncbi:MAG: NUDIX hydrolase [Anaerolineae bacterium]|nr:NUDIX hydrolase [Anaerolineae bacterium]
MSDSRDYPARPIAGVGVIVCKDDAVLLIRRGKPPRAGEWGIPGGVVELGETWRDAARREVREECGIEIRIEAIADAVDIIVHDDAARVQYHYALVDFAASYVSGDLRASSDVLEARWVAFSELHHFPLPDKTRAVIRKAMRRKMEDERQTTEDGGRKTEDFRF